MAEKQEKAIYRLEMHIKFAVLSNDKLAVVNKADIETVLNMLKEKDKEIENKDKIIDLMAENIFEEGIIWDDKEEVKQYFKSKAEKE